MNASFETKQRLNAIYAIYKKRFPQASKNHICELLGADLARITRPNSKRPYGAKYVLSLLSGSKPIPATLQGPIKKLLVQLTKPKKPTRKRNRIFADCENAEQMKRIKTNMSGAEMVQILDSFTNGFYICAECKTPVRVYGEIKNKENKVCTACRYIKRQRERRTGKQPQ